MMIRGRHRHLALLAGLLLLGQAARAAAQAKEAVPGLEAVVEQREHVSTELARLAGGLERALKKDDVKAAESLYGMERAAIRLLEVTSVAAFPSEVSRLETQQSVRMLLTRILQLQERVQQHAIAELDRSLPGEPGREGWARAGSGGGAVRSRTPCTWVLICSSVKVFFDLRSSFTSSGSSGMIEVTTMWLSGTPALTSCWTGPSVEPGPGL